MWTIEERGTRKVVGVQFQLELRGRYTISQVNKILAILIPSYKVTMIANTKSTDLVQGSVPTLMTDSIQGTELGDGN